MKLIDKLLFLSIYIVFAVSFAQELPPVQNFLPKDYNAENQNWAISQSAEKLIYVANNKGLLEFNGANWKLYHSPNETIMRSVQVVHDRIYTGCFMEFGYWQKNDLGILTYKSLSKQLGINLIEDEEFWNIVHIDKYVIFQSLRRIYIYNVDDGFVNAIDSESIITKIFKVDESIYFQRLGKGIFKIENGKDFLVTDDDIVKNNEIITIFKSSKDLLILTKDNGFYSWSDNLLLKPNKDPNELLTKISVYAGIRLKDNSFVLGTISNGLVYLNEKGDFLYKIDKEKGLSNNTVLSLFEDADNNIWLGLDNGISYVNLNSPFKEYDDNQGILGSVYTSAIHNGNLYLGTNQGLFYKSLKSNDDFSFIKGTQGQVWCLKVIDQTLFCGHHLGTFLIQGNQVTKISNVQGTWDINKLDNKSNLLLQGNYDGLHILEKSKNNWQLKNKINGFNNSSRYFETLGNEIFVNHEYNGIFKIEVDTSFSQVINVSIDTLIKGYNSGIIKYNGELLYSYKNGIFKYNTINKKFIKDSILSTVYSEEEYVSGKLILNEKDNELWVFTDSNISFISPGELTSYPKIKSIPLIKDVRKEIFGYEDIIEFDDDNKYLFGTTSGYITVNMNELKINNFQVHIASVTNGKNNAINNLLNNKLKGDFNSNENNLDISFYTPEFNKFLSPLYQFQLTGIYDEWSIWSENSNVIFENLPFGNYTFNVRAKIGNNISTNIATYSFKIGKPWYISNSMVAFYIVGILFFSFFMHHLYKQFYSRQRQKLIDKNKRELELAQIQNEKEIIRIKNERLQVEFKSKSKELAASTMSIIKKNELLMAIKEELNAVPDKNSVKPVINIIDKSLAQNNDWEFFREAFNNADSEFLKKIKTLHPTLTPNDLKLCAYLRLNLSSKEIAQLLNISSRSVEIKRYRLRKKLNLLHEENLVNYILKL